MSRTQASVAARPGASGARWLLVLAVIAVLVALAHARRVNCRVNVYHESCRGVARRSGRSRLAGVARSHALQRFLSTLFSDQSRTRKLRALERYLERREPSHVSEEHAASLLDRLLRVEEDYSDDYDVDV